MSYKICPACGAKNSIDEIICKECSIDISSVTPTEEKENILVLENEEITLKIKPNDIVGRNYKGAEHLAEYPTVSRKHCEFLYENNKWYVEDLESTNKTYLNKKAIEPLTKIEIKNGDEISLSRSLKFKVKV